MRKILIMLSILIVMLFMSCSKKSPTQQNEPETLPKGNYQAPLARTAPMINGIADDAAWESADWAKIDELWLGAAPTEQDFSGQYKIVWTPERLYILVSLTDDNLVDKYRDPLEQYWNDDCLEIFLDEDRSKGDHTYNYSAFAYHVSYERHSVDIGTDQEPHLFDHHVEAKWSNNGNDITWELAIDIYDDNFEYAGNNSPVTLAAGKVMGYMVAYCDADGSNGRESFIGSIPISGQDKNLGWRDAGVFGELTLVE